MSRAWCRRGPTPGSEKRVRMFTHDVRYAGDKDQHSLIHRRGTSQILGHYLGWRVDTAMLLPS